MAHWPYCTSKWARLRAAKLAETPLCEICTRRGLAVEAVAVDHFTPIRQGGPAFPELSGLLALCEPCHNEKTAAFDKPGGQPFRRRFRGFDADGNPVDPFDAWHGAGGGSRTGNRQPRTGGEAERILNNGKGD
ncbi:MAG: HNH endonuclease signature motif containing protein [Paracoccus sp. (in: a-proteobacteria)]